MMSMCPRQDYRALTRVALHPTATNATQRLVKPSVAMATVSQALRGVVASRTRTRKRKRQTARNCQATSTASDLSSVDDTLPQPAQQNVTRGRGPAPPSPLPSPPTPMEAIEDSDGERDEGEGERNGEEGREDTPQDTGVREMTRAFRRKLFVGNGGREMEKEKVIFCADYADDIYQHLHRLEAQYQPDADYMSSQTDINVRMRAILVDWLVLVHIKFQLQQETLYLTISVIDRYLQFCVVPKDQLQLVGVTSMLIACKYEEIYYPKIEDFVYVTDSTYTGDEIRQMETQILTVLGYTVSNPTPLIFLRRYSRAGQVTARMHILAKYLLELALTDYSMLLYLPSRQAAATLCLAMNVYPSNPQSPTLELCSGYTQNDLLPCMSAFAHLVAKLPVAKQQAVRNKYSGSEYFQVAKEKGLAGEFVKQLASHYTPRPHLGPRPST